LQKNHIEEEANKAAMMRANATMSRRQKENERQLDAAVNAERAKVLREAREQVLEEEDAKQILDKTRDWQDDIEERRYESYMKNFAVQIGHEVNGEAKSKEDEVSEKKDEKKQAKDEKKPAKSDASKPEKQLASLHQLSVPHGASLLNGTQSSLAP
jgi:hypothetical protein